MILNVKIFLNPRPEDFDKEEETNYIEVVMEQSLNLICHKDPMEVVLIGLVTDCECYNP